MPKIKKARFGLVHLESQLLYHVTVQSIKHTELQTVANMEVPFYSALGLSLSIQMIVQ